MVIELIYVFHNHATRRLDLDSRRLHKSKYPGRFLLEIKPGSKSYGTVSKFTASHHLHEPSIGLLLQRSASPKWGKSVKTVILVHGIQIPARYTNISINYITDEKTAPNLLLSNSISPWSPRCTLKYRIT